MINGGGFVGILTFNRAESLSVQQIHTFCRVYELGGYAGASEQLGLAGPTMWEQVKALERIYQTGLFQRSGRNIRPTPAGDVLYRLLTPLLATVESTFEILAEQADQGSLQIRLVTGVRMMLEELGQPLRDFKRSYPDLTLKFMTADNRVAQELLLEDKADLALLIEPPKDIVAHGIVWEKLYRIGYLAAFPPKHRLSKNENFTLQALVNEPLVVGNPNTVGRRMLEQALFRLGINSPLRIAAETDNSAITLACVRAGIGIGIIAGRPDGNLTRDIKTRSLTNELGQVHVVAAYRKGRQLTNALKTLLDRLRIQSTRSEA